MPSLFRLAALGLATALAGPAAAGPLTFDQALERALATAPSLQAAALEARAARAAAQAAGRLPDPKLTFGVDNFPVSGPHAGRYEEDFMTMTRVGVMQEVPNAARRRAEVAGASAEIGAAEAEAALEARDVQVAAALAWIDLWYAERRLASLDELVSGLKGLWDAQPASVASGEARPAAGTEPARLQAVFADRRSELAAAVARARAELTRWTGEAAPHALGEPPRYEIDPGVLRAALERHPTLLTAAAGERRARAAVDAARAARRPDWSFEASYARRGPMFGDMVSAGVTVSLPLFARTRQDPIIAARTAQAGRAELLREDARRALAAALEGDLAEHKSHHEQWERAVKVLVPAAERRADLELASYAAGRAAFDEVMMAVTDLADARLTALDREAKATRHGVRIVLTYGSDR